MSVSAEVWTTTVADWGSGLGGSVSQTFSIHFLNVRPFSSLLFFSLLFSSFFLLVFFSSGI